MERYNPSLKMPQLDTGSALIKGGEGKTQERSPLNDGGIAQSGHVHNLVVNS